jgi:hypothetical protein
MGYSCHSAEQFCVSEGRILKQNPTATAMKLFGAARRATYTTGRYMHNTKVTSECNQMALRTKIHRDQTR